MNTASGAAAHDMRRAAWTRYWQGGNLHSLGTSFSGNYEGGIAAFWRDVFATLADGQRVLDLGTGNGALPLLLHDVRPSTGIEVDAVDLAEPTPAWHAALASDARARIRFHGGVRAEALPFPDDSFDIAVSQYGIEYTDHAVSILELARTLRAGSRCAFVIHHARSQLLEVAHDELTAAARLLADDGLLRQAELLLPFLGMVAAGQAERLRDDVRANQTRAAFNACMQATAAATDMGHPALLLDAQEWVAGMTQAVLQRQISAEQAGRMLADYRDDIMLARLRNEELRDCALDNEGIGRFAAMLEAAGFTDVDHAPFHHDDYLIGWRMQARR